MAGARCQGFLGQSVMTTSRRNAMAEPQRPRIIEAAARTSAAHQRYGAGLHVASVASVLADLLHHADRLWWLASFYPTMTSMGQRHHDHDDDSDRQ
jgi:hypothetical protein